MSTANVPSSGVSPAVLQPITVDHLLTAADVAALPDVLPSGQVKYELDRGRLVVMPMPGRRHGSIQTRIASAFFVQGEEKGFGEAFTETGVVLARNPDTVRGPDVAFVGRAKFPVIESPEGFLLTIPDVVVEIRSKNDTSNRLREKADEYLQAGVACVWIVDPTSKTVTVHTPGENARTYQGEETLPPPAAIPGFSLSVRALFNSTA